MYYVLMNRMTIIKTSIKTQSQKESKVIQEITNIFKMFGSFSSFKNMKMQDSNTRVGSREGFA